MSITGNNKVSEYFTALIIRNKFVFSRYFFELASPGLSRAELEDHNYVLFVMFNPSTGSLHTTIS